MANLACPDCGIEWNSRFVADKCPRCQQHPGTRSPEADLPPMPHGEIEAIMVQLRLMGWHGYTQKS